MKIPSAHPAAREWNIIFLLGLFAAIHVFIFSAAFPFFNVVDEQAQFDMVVRYSQGHIPQAFAPPCAEALPYITVFDTPEYLYPPSSLYRGIMPPPVWTLPDDLSRKILAQRKAVWNTIENHELSQPPLYYSMAGLWWRAGKLSGLTGGELLCWLRCLNLIFVSALIWSGWYAGRIIFPENRFIRIAIPSLIAFLPQTAFYSINNDILSPLTFGAAFLLLLKFQETETPAPLPAAATGLALAATFLTKISNLPLLAMAGFFLAVKYFKLSQNGKLRAALSSAQILFLCAVLPMTAWMIWCRMNFGDFTGSAPKMSFLHWTDKPVSEWIHHPIFTLHGFWFFLSRNISTFWQGEFLWHGRPLAISSVDLFYVVLTLAVLICAFAALLKSAARIVPGQRAGLWFSFACLAAMFGFLALLSVKYDFHDCFYPSRVSPYFVSGRLMLGALIPFMTLFAYGFDFALKRFDLAVKFTVLAMLLIFMLASEITVDWEIFPNAYNWFHM